MGRFMSKKTPAIRGGFSLIELVIVVVIIGIIGAIAIPRMSRGAAGATDSALVANLAVLRNAIDLYATEHGGAYPKLADLNKKSIAEDAAGGNPLLDYTNASGSKIGSKTPSTDTTTPEADRLILGPYLRSIPALPVGENKGLNNFVTSVTGSGGWVYDEETGEISAACPDSEVDAKGKKYNTY